MQCAARPVTRPAHCIGQIADCCAWCVDVEAWSGDCLCPCVLRQHCCLQLHAHRPCAGSVNAVLVARPIIRTDEGAPRGIPKSKAASSRTGLCQKTASSMQQWCAAVGMQHSHVQQRQRTRLHEAASSWCRELQLLSSRSSAAIGVLRLVEPRVPDGAAWRRNTVSPV